MPLAYLSRPRRHESSALGTARRQVALTQFVPWLARESYFDFVVSTFGDSPQPQTGAVAQRIDANGPLPSSVMPRHAYREMLVRECPSSHAFVSFPTISIR